MMGSLRQFLGKCMDTLPAPERLVLSLCYYEDLTMKDLARILKVTDSRVCQIHSKAMKELKARLQSDTAFA